MKKKSLLTIFVLSLLILLVYVLIVGAVDYFISSSGSYYVDNVVWKTTLSGTTNSDYFGVSVAAGDVNNDTYIDIIVGADGVSSSTGRVYVFFGTADGISDMSATNANITIDGTAASDSFGSSVASGDVNNDSYDDVIVGAWQADPSNTGGAGQAYVFFGADFTEKIDPVQTASDYANITINGTAGNDYLGKFVAAGDVNNDTYADVIIGAWTADPSGNNNAGQAYVFFGADFTEKVDPTLNASDYANITINGTKAGDQFGFPIAAGDVNNDSYEDIIIGAIDANGAAGQAYVFFGADFTEKIDPVQTSSGYANITINGTLANDYFGDSLAAGDVNNDTYDDIIVGAKWADPSGAGDAGQAYVFFGADFTEKIDPVQTASGYANITINGTLANDYFGGAFATGDVNNDGYADIIAGDYYAPGATYAGQAYVFFGADFTEKVDPTLNASDYANITINGTAQNDKLGISVASGDVNNDSYDDIIIGASQAPRSGGNSGPGRVYIYEYDDIYPVISLDNPADFYNETGSGFVTFNYTAIDTHLDYCELWGNWSGGWHLNETFVSPASGETNGSSNISLEDGQYVWTVYCNDTVNNYNNTVDNFTLVVNASVPLISLNAPVDFANFSAALDFNYTAVDGDLDTCELWGNWTTGWHLNETFVNPGSDVANGSSVITLEDGQYVWSVYCNDSWDNWNTTVQNFTLTVDLTAPVIGLDDPVDFFNETSTGAVVFNFTSNDSLSLIDTCELWGNWTIGWHLNESFYTSLVSGEPYNSSNITIEDGQYVWSVYCNDSLGNYNNTVENRTLTVDLTGPSITLALPLNNTADTDGLVYFNYTAIDAYSGVDSCWLTIDGIINVTNTTSEIPENFTVSLTEGRYAWNISCNDTFNNVANSDTYDLSVDLSTEFSGDTTDLSQLNVTNITNFIIDFPSDGKINFTDDVDLSNGSDLNTYVNISFNRVEVNVSSLLSDLNKSAILYLYNLTFSDPKILRDDLDCPSDACTELLYTGGTLEFNVSGFSVYSAAETPTTETPSSSGGSSSTGQGGYGCVDVSEGVVRTMSIDDAVVICIGESGGGSAGGEAGHQTVLDEMTSDSVTLWIYSTPIRVTLKVGESKKVDVDADGILDLLIELRSIDFAHQKSEVYFEDITPKKEAAQSEEVKEEEVAEEEPVVPTGEAPAVPEETSSKAWLWILIIVVIVVISVGYWFMKKKKQIIP